MNERHDPLEAELSALQPHPVSPGLRGRVAASLAEAAAPTRRPRFWLVVAGGLAAACLAAAVVWWGASRNVEPEPPVVRNQPQHPLPPAEAGEAGDRGPTLLMCQRALAHSPEALDALLDEAAAAALQPNPEHLQIGVLIRSDMGLHHFQGDD